MKRLYSTDNPILAGQIGSLLEDSGIVCLIRNKYLGGAAGELPVNECWPEIWVVEEQEFSRAKALVDGFLADPVEPGESWICAQCGEALEAQFTQCWRCGSRCGENV